MSPWRAKSAKFQPTPAKSDLSLLSGIARKWQYHDVAAWDCKTSIPGPSARASPTFAIEKALDAAGGFDHRFPEQASDCVTLSTVPIVSNAVSDRAITLSLPIDPMASPFEASRCE